MVVGSTTQRPAVGAFDFGDGRIVDAGDTSLHEPLGVELPEFVAIRAEPLAASIVVFVGKADGDAVFTESPDFLDQPIVQFERPLAGQKSDDRLAPFEEFGPVPPPAGGRVGQRTLAGSRVFQASSASRTLAMAVAIVNGGRGGGSRFGMIRLHGTRVGPEGRGSRLPVP